MKRKPSGKTVRNMLENDEAPSCPAFYLESPDSTGLQKKARAEELYMGKEVGRR